jgi:hypothetical protein
MTDDAGIALNRIIDIREAEIKVLRAENAALKAEVERLTLVWSSEPPTENGDYLVEWTNGRITAEVMTDVERASHYTHAVRWCGPIVVQEPATQGEVNHA